jgi:hypothetical protein
MFPINVPSSYLLNYLQQGRGHIVPQKDIEELLEGETDVGRPQNANHPFHKGAN